VGIVRVRFALFGVSYETQIDVRGNGDRSLQTTFPLVLRRRRRRRDRRVQISPRDPVRVVFWNPATRTEEQRSVVDVSFRGLSFRVDKGRDVLWPDLPLSRVALSWRERSVNLGDVEVRGTTATGDGGEICHTATSNPAVADDRTMIDLIATAGHPELTVDDGDNFRELLSTYRRAKVFYGYMVGNLELVAPQAAANVKRLRTHAPELARTLNHQTEGSIDATLSVMRAWEHTWIVQHLGTTSKEGFRWSGEMQMAALDYLLPRPEGRFVFFFIDVNNRSMNAFYSRFFDLTGTPEAIERGQRELHLWTAPRDESRSDRPPRGDLRMRAIRRTDQTLIAHAGERALGPMTAAALSLVPGEIDLPDTTRRYAAAGLVRARRARLVTRRREPRLCVLDERSSPGLNLAGHLNATWLIPVVDVDCDAFHVALSAIEAEPCQIPGGDRFAFVPEGDAADVLHARGWTLQTKFYTHTLNRAGLLRFYEYIADRYGVLGARAGARRRERGDTA
jgi:hypothetical protein